MTAASWLSRFQQLVKQGRSKSDALRIAMEEQKVAKEEAKAKAERAEKKRKAKEDAKRKRDKKGLGVDKSDPKDP